MTLRSYRSKPGNNFASHTESSESTGNPITGEWAYSESSSTLPQNEALVDCGKEGLWPPLALISGEKWKTRVAIFNFMIFYDVFQGR